MHWCALKLWEKPIPPPSLNLEPRNKLGSISPSEYVKGADEKAWVLAFITFYSPLFLMSPTSLTHHYMMPWWCHAWPLTSSHHHAIPWWCHAIFGMIFMCMHPCARVAMPHSKHVCQCVHAHHTHMVTNCDPQCIPWHPPLGTSACAHIHLPGYDLF